MVASKDLSEEALELLKVSYLRVENGTAARRLWSQVYSARDRECLGGECEQSYRMRRNVRAWMYLRNVSGERAVAELAYQLGFISQTTLERLLSELGEVALEPTFAAVPDWNPETGELRFHGQLIRRIRSPWNAVNLVCILNAFQAQSWARRIQDPLPGGRDPQRLREAVYKLNRNLNAISFRNDGNGNGVIWEIA